MFPAPSSTYPLLSRTYQLLVVFCALSLSLSVVSCGGSGSSSQPPPPSLSLTASPNPLVIYPSSSFTVKVSATTNTSTAPTITSVQLPSGITTITTFPLTVPSDGVSITFQTASTITAGTYTLMFAGVAGPATASVNISATLQTNPPSFFFVAGLASEVGISFGGSGQAQFTIQANGQAFYNVQLSLSGLPAGTTATISPQTITPGQSGVVTVTASSAAPESQNVTVTLTGTPSAPVAPASTTFLVDVTPKPGFLPNNRTDYVSTDDTPYGAVYDPVHQLIFASNTAWNRVEVISSTTHAIVARIPIREPRGIDITQDKSTVWVATGSRQMFAINTATLALTRYLLPVGSVGYWEGSQLFTLADGTLMIVLTQGTGLPSSGIAV